MSNDGAVSGFFRHSAIYALGSAMNRLGAFLLLPLYTRYLSLSEYGTLELFYAISAVVSGFLSVGIAHATLRFYFEYEAVEDRNAVVSTNFLASLAIGLSGALILGVFAQPLAQTLVDGRPSQLALFLVLATLVLELSSQVGLAYLRAREMSVMFIGLSSAKLVVQCVANAILLLRFDSGVEGVLAGNLLAVALGWGMLSVLVWRQCGLRFERAKLFPVLRYGLPFLYVTVIASVSGNFDRFLVNHLLSIEALGVYALATKFSKLISDLLGEPFNRAYGAFRFSIMKRDDAAMIQADVLRYVATGLAVVSLALIYFTADVIRWVATPTYASAAGLMPLLVVAASLQMLNYLLQTGILINKSTKQLVAITLARSGMSLALGYPLIYAFGLQGACGLALCDAVLATVMTHRISQRYFPVQYDLPRLTVLAGLLGGFFAVGLLVTFPGWAGLAMKASLLLLFITSAIYTQLAPAERRAGIVALAAVGRRRHAPL